MKNICIYSDGACSGNPGPGGFGAVLIYNDLIKEIYGSEAHTTNNKMELKGAIEGLKALKQPSIVDLYTDSKYVKQGITEWIISWQKNNWKNSKKQPVANQELWQELLTLTKIHQVSWHWVKGHADNKFNNMADALACKGKDEALNVK